MFSASDSSMPVCTIRRHPEGGFCPMLHLPGTSPPEPLPDTISFPGIGEAVRYAQNHFGFCAVTVAEECKASHAV